jgi:hypothetical protein
MKRLQNIPWARIAAESVAIVISILMAFAIDAWWSERQIAHEVKENLVALKVELAGNLDLIEREMNYRKAVMASIEKINSALINAEPLSSEEIDILLGDLMWLGKSEFSTGALQSILQSGLYGQIEDGELRRLLASLPALYDYVLKFELDDIESTTHQFYSYIHANGSFNQIANTTTRGRPGTGEFLVNYHYHVFESRDHAQLLQSDEFLGILTQEHWDQYNVLANLQRLKPRVEAAISLIDLQLR